MFKNEMLNTLINLQKKGIEIHMTDDGWKEFLLLMSNEVVVIEAESREFEDNGLAVG